MNAELRTALEALPGTRFIDFRTFAGPSPFSSERVVAVTLGIDDDDGSLARAAAILRRALPEWHEPPEPPAIEGARTAFDVVAAWCTTILLDAGGGIVDAGVAPAGSASTLWVGYDDVRATQIVVAEALAILGQALSHYEGGPLDGLRDRAGTLVRTIQPLIPHSQWRLLAEAAKARSIPMLTMFDPAMRQYGWGARGRLFWETTSNADGVVGHILSRSKAGMKQMIAALGYPTPLACTLSASDPPSAAADRLGWPLVVKPLDRGGGKGVTADIRSIDQLEAAVARARGLTSRPLLVERHVDGEDHRLMVVDGELVAAIRRSPATVVGDGESSVGMLIDALNRTRLRDLHSRLYLKQIAVDEILLEQLAAQAVDLGSVPPAGAAIRLRSNANRSTGGDCVDVTSSVHPDVAAAAVAICETIGLRCAGLDYLCKDISLPPDAGGGSFIEVNTTPGLSAIAAAGADAVAVAGRILGDAGRIPSTLIVAPRQAWPGLRTTLSRAPTERGISWACGGAARIGGRDVPLSDRSAQDQAVMLLTARQTREIIIVCGADELMRDGLPVDRVDVSILCETLPPEWQAVVERHSGQWRNAAADQIGWKNAAS